MDGIYSSIIFYPIAILIILFALLTIKFKNIFYSLLSAILVFFLTGVLFYILGSEYNAIIQVAIYGVAVPIVLGLAIMFTNFKKDKKINLEASSTNLNYALFLTCGIFILALIYLMMTSFAMNPVGFNVVEFSSLNHAQVMNSFSHGIFVDYVWAFELVSIILTIIVVGLTLFNKIKEEDICKK